MKLNIQQKLESLGGIDPNPLCPSVEKDISSLEEFLGQLGYVLPDNYKSFVEKYCPFSFKEQVRFVLDALVSGLGDMVTVDYFYGGLLDTESDCSVVKIYRQYSNQIPQGYLPICDGESGDLILLCLSEEYYGHVFYWFHEGGEGQDLFLLKEDFDQFIMSLILVPEVAEEYDNIRDSKLEVSNELRRMLEDDGYIQKK